MNFSSFADDLRISYSNANIGRILATLKRSLIIIQGKLKEKCLDISFPKTKLILFSQSTKPIPPYSRKIIIELNEIKNEVQAKYLGVIWDAGMNWKSRYKAIRNKCGKLLNVLSAIANFKWGAHPETLLQIYKGLIRPTIEWASFLFTPESYEKANLLNTLQNYALRISLGCMSTTPINILVHLSGIPTIIERFKELTSRFLIKKLSVRNNTIESTLRKIQTLYTHCRDQNVTKHESALYRAWQDIKTEMNIVRRSDRLETYSTKYEALFIEKIVDTNLGQEMKPPMGDPGKFEELINGKYPHFTKIFTDGSLNREKKKCGLGIYIEKYAHLSVNLSLHPENTIYGAEIVAINYAIKRAIANEIVEDILICTDSMSAAKKLKKMGLDSNMRQEVAEIRTNICEERKKGKIIKIIWIPAHVGIKGNETADAMAKNASLKETIDINFMNYGDLNHKLREKTKEGAAKFVENYSKGQNPKGYRYIKFSGKFSFTPWFKGLSMSRDRIGMANRLKANHCRNKAHLKRMSIINEDICDCGEDTETVEHIVWWCPKLAKERKKLTEFMESKNIPFDSLIDKLMIEENLDVTFRILEFLKSIKVEV